MRHYSPNRGKTLRGKTPSIKIPGRMVRTASLVELDTAFLLDVQYGVTTYEEQPFAIEYWVDGELHEYTPDYLVEYFSNNVLIECKPESKIDSDDVRIKANAARDFCAERGWAYKIVTDRHIRTGYRLDNAKLISRYAKQRLYPWIRDRVLAAFEPGRNSIPISELGHIACPEDHRQGANMVLHMIAMHELYVPLDKELITPNSDVEPQRGQDSIPFWDLSMPPKPYVHPASNIQVYCR